VESLKILGIDLGGTNVRAGLVCGENLLQVVTDTIPGQGTVGQILDSIFTAIDKIMEPGIAGIGIGVPSVVDIERGIVYDVQNIPSWKEVHLKHILEERYRVPVYVNNDANCFALGEKYYGKGQGCHSLVGLILGTGFAAGLILDGRLYSGLHCGAGEIGMLPYRDAVYESYCSGQFFRDNFGIDGAQAARQAEAGKASARDMFVEYGRHLGEAIKMVLYAYDPQMIVLGGSIRKSFAFYKDAMWASVRSFAYANSLSGLRIEVSELEHVAVLGAAALYLDRQRTA